MYNCQNANYIVNNFSFLYILYRFVPCFVKYTDTMKFLKNIYLNVIFIIKLEHVQLIITLMITYAIIFERTDKT